MHQHILLSSLGISGPKDLSYTKDGRIEPAAFSSFAIWKLLPESQRPTEIWFLLTPQARDAAWKSIEEDATELGVAVRSIDLAANLADDSIEFLELAAGQIPAECKLTLNVTEGLRHHAFLFYALALYLTTFRRVEIVGAWYCRLETENRDAPKPIIDLKPVLDLAQWFHALAVFQETGSLRPVSSLVSDNQTRELLRQLSQFFLTGLPIEAGDAASRIVQRAADVGLLPDIPLRTELEQHLLEKVRPLAGTLLDGQSKKNVLLDRKEIHRQAEFIRKYFETDQLNLALGLSREWIVNVLMQNTAATNSWLERTTRESVERAIGGLDIIHRDKRNHPRVRQQLDEKQVEWAKRWAAITENRNLLQHHGMKTAAFNPTGKNISKVREDIASADGWPEFVGPGGGQERLLVCPFGNAKGVLYSAISHVRPRRVVVVCSGQSREHIPQAIREATSGDIAPVEVLEIQMANPQAGISEFSTLIEQASLWLFEADEVHVCLTGGTSLMGVLAGRMRDRAAREYQRSIREFVLIDPRTPQEQLDDPWRLGEIHYFDDPSENAASTSSDTERGVQKTT